MSVFDSSRVRATRGWPVRFPWLLAALVCAGGVSPLPAQEKAAKTPKARAASPRHDPGDIPFRRAPMSVATRTVHLPLATNLHLAFDTELLRTHTVWEGPTLNLWGTVYHAAKDRYYCDHDGRVLWTNAPVLPWTYRKPEPTGHVDAVPPMRFLGLSTRGGHTTVIYQMTLYDGQVVPIHESARHPAGAPAGTIERRFEIGPSDKSLTLLAHAAAVDLLPAPEGLPVALFQHPDHVVLVAARANCKLKLQTSNKEETYESIVWREQKNDSERVRHGHSAPESRCYIRIPLHQEPIVVEVLSLIAPDAKTAIERLRALPKTELQPPRLELLISGAPDPAPEGAVFAGEKGFTVPAGDAHYRLERFPLPRQIELQVTGMDFLPNGDLAVCTWLGDVYLVQGATNAPAQATYRRFARGLCEPGGLRVIDGVIHVVQKQELTRLRDTDGNGEADLFECVSQDWGFTGNYHDFSFGPAVDRAGNLYVMRNGNRGHYEVPRMGWCLKISPDGGTVEPFSRGLRSPNSFGTYGPDGDIFMGDNQGNWIAVNTLAHMQAGRFYGFPSTYPAPKEEYVYATSRQVTPPAIWFPYQLARSVSGLAPVPEDDRFGPFGGQLLVGDFQNAIVMRVALEQVNGEWQGAVFPFARGFESGVNRLAFGPDGKLYVGGCKNRAWAAVAPREWSLDRVSFTGRAPFEVRNVRALPDGFELTFTEPVEAAAAGNPDSYDVLQYNYRYHEKYGSPEYDHDGKENSATTIKVTGAGVSADRLKVRLKLAGWKAGFVTMVRCLDVVNADARPLRHDTFWYTLNAIPGS